MGEVMLGGIYCACAASPFIPFIGEGGGCDSLRSFSKAGFLTRLSVPFM